jgi:DNA-binding NarL/FixJ family response regulator
MASRVDALSIIEAAYRPFESEQEWAQSITDVIAKVAGGVPAGALLYDAASPPWVHIEGTAWSGVPEGFACAILNLLRPNDSGSELVGLYRTLRFASVRESFVPVEPRIGAILDAFGLQDFGVVNATAPTFRGVLFMMSASAGGFPTRTRYFWRRVGAHLQAGLRLQRALTGLRAAKSPRARAEVVLLSNGRVEHAVEDAQSVDARQALQDALVRIADARDMPDDQALRAADLWTGLCAGRWSLIEHFENDGRRYFLAHRNDPRLAPTRALTERERQVFMDAAMGRSNKLIAYSLGLSISTVAAHLDRARRKVGGGASLEALQAVVPIDLLRQGRNLHARTGPRRVNAG